MAQLTAFTRNSIVLVLLMSVGLSSSNSVFRSRDISKHSGYRAHKSDLLVLPCSQNVVVESSGVLNYLGNVTFTAPTDLKGHWQLSMKTSRPFTFLGGWGVTISENGAKGIAEITSKGEVSVQAGETITFRFRISFSQDGTIPYVSGLKWQGHEICGSQQDAIAPIPVRRRRWHFKRAPVVAQA